jgi:hypothetical protein
MMPLKAMVGLKTVIATLYAYRFKLLIKAAVDLTGNMFKEIGVQMTQR